ncbi:MAG: DUF4040 domain-containing protein, partial [Steroidobacteraceae bacterium]|nr:DUF4040 domain-containing protein [Steroidobacteraceae bacterium]MDW8260675.1 proton-conducting transporter membrane subunit [Gammaproteobacteria bacterium]
LLGAAAGSFELSEIVARGATIRSAPTYPWILGLVLLGAFTKSAQLPFHFWLPQAMAAPTPVSAYLHSATMVKAGVFLLARLYPALAGTDLWFVSVTLIGALTFVFGAYLALLKHDFKSLLAHSTVSHLGLITLLLGLDTPMSVVAGLFHIVNHAIFKASLFMAAGVIDHECGTRDMRRINGLFKYMPWTATLAIVAAGAMAGVPLLNGFLSKEMFFAEAIGHPAFAGLADWVVPTLATAAGAMSVAYSARFAHDVFFNGEPVDLPRQPHEPARWMRAPIEILVVLVLIVGLAPQFAVGALLVSAAAAVLPQGVPEFRLALWHGFNLPLLMSGAALAAGLAYYSVRHVVFRWHAQLAPTLTSPVAFERLFAGSSRLAARLLARLDRGSVRHWLATFIGFTVLLAVAGWLDADQRAVAGALPPQPITAEFLAGAAVLLVAVGAVVRYAREYLTALIGVSVVGLVVVLAFARLAAPDLALTQLAVEAATLVLLLLALQFWPAQAPREAPARWIGHLAIAVAAGAGTGLLAYALLSRPFETISAYHLANAVPLGGGSNVVNVILVDFRGFDTYGEIVVLLIAALGVSALVEGLQLPPQQAVTASEQDRHPILLAMLMRPMLPLLLVGALYLFLRGHYLPGGGFIAGLVAAVALLLQYVASGSDWVRTQLRVDFLRLAAVGVLLATVTGLAALLFGRPFLTSAHGYVELPLLGSVPWATALLFDLGVGLLVVGVTLALLTLFGALNLRADRQAASGAPPWR